MPARTPITQRIVDDIRSDIATGRLKPGDALPSISALGRRYDCSDTPVKRALAVLHALGLIEGHQGKGTFVATADPKG